MSVLIACEESQTVCKAFREKGIEAYSCDIQQPSGGHPEWHILGDALEAMKGGRVLTMDGVEHEVGKWELLIAHPPCTYLSNVATRSFSLRCTAPEKVCDRWKKRAEAAVFFMRFFGANADRICIENPVGFLNSVLEKESRQIVHPYMFAAGSDDRENYVTKRTCLWLVNLPPLIGTQTQKCDNATIYGRTRTSNKVRYWAMVTRGAKTRSKTFPGIARAMAEQWGGLLIAADCTDGGQ